MEINQLNQNLFDVFSANAETFVDAKKKHQEETATKNKYLKLNTNGTVSVRILPLAPVINAQGEIEMPRKGYEYPVKEHMLRIVKPNTDGKNQKKSMIYVNVCNAKQAFPKLSNDLIDTYVQVVLEKYGDNEALVKKIQSSGFEGGLKYDRKRCLYVFDLQNRQDGLQLLKLSFSQYRDLEDRKLILWEKLSRKSTSAQCPISSITNAYPVDITGKTESKTTYSFNIDTVSDPEPLTKEELQALLDAPRLPEVLYRYTNYHLEATVVYLKQLDEKFQINVMGSEQIQDVIDQIKLCLPADDTSHFTFDSGSSTEEGSAEQGDSLEDLWDMYDELTQAGVEDTSEEGKDLRSKLKAYITAKDIDVKVTRGMSNHDILCAIDETLNPSKPTDKGFEDEDEDEDDDRPVAAPAPAPAPAPTPQPAQDTTRRSSDRPRVRRSF